MDERQESTPGKRIRRPVREVRWLLGFATVVVVAGAVALTLLLTLREAPREPEQTQPIEHATPSVAVGTGIGQRAPDFVLPSLSGGSVALSDYRGSVVILDFWASWCGPCKATFPVIHSLWETYADRGAVLVGISLDRSEADARSYLNQAGFDDMVALWGSLPAASAVASTYNVGGIPHTFVIDREGIVRFAGHPAYLGTETLHEIID